MIFDFDGTLSDTTRCVTATLERVLSANGFTRDEMGDLRRFVGPPLVDAFQEIYGMDRAEAERYTAQYRAAFDDMTPADYPVFEGLPALLDDLVAAGRRLAIATSRLEERALSMIDELGLTQVPVVRGMNVPAGRATKVDAIRDVLIVCGTGPEDAVMVGDTHFDVEGAHALGLPCIGVTYGATSTAAELRAAGADAVCATVDALRALLLGDAHPTRSRPVA